MHNQASVLENRIRKFQCDFDIKNGSPNLGQTIRPYNNQQKKKEKKENLKIVEFAVPTDNRVTLKESEKKDIYL